MTDTGLYGLSAGGLDTFGDQRINRLYRANELTMRANAILRVNPYMRNDPNALMALASSQLDAVTVVDHAAAMYGIQTGSGMRQQLERMSGSAQRATFNQLTPGQQMALGQQGYRPPKPERDAWYEDLAKTVGDVGGNVLGAVGNVGEALQLDKVLDIMTWAGDRPFHLYRTIRMMPEWSQVAAIAGAAIGVGALFLAPVSGGLSLAALGAVGGGTLTTAGSIGAAALLGGTAAAAITNHDDWFEAFKVGWGRDTQLGERQFERGAVTRATDLLGDPRLVNMARTIADRLPPDMNLSELAQAVAGVRGTGTDTALAAMQGIAGKFASEGTPEYQKVLGGLVQLYQEPAFQEAVTTLQQGKISIGRDIADMLGWVAQFDQNSSIHTLISGTIDAASILALDPLLVGSKAVRAVANTKYALYADHGGQSLAQRFLDIAEHNPRVRRYHEVLADAIDRGDYTRFRKAGPEYRGLEDQLFAHRKVLADSNLLDNGKFTAQHLREWIAVTKEMKPILQGYGTIRGLSGPIVLARATPVRLAARAITGRVGALTAGLTDAAAETQVVDYLKRVMDTSGDAAANRRLTELFPFATHGDIAETLLDHHLKVLTDRVAAAADEFEQALPAVRASAIRDTSLARPLTLDIDGRTIDATGLDVFDPDVADAVLEIERIRSGAYAPEELLTVDRLTPDVLKTLALHGEDYQSWRQWGRFLGERSRVAARFGRIAERVSTMAPAGTFVQLAGDGSGESIRQFVELSAYADMPQWARRDWENMLVYQPDTNFRLTQVQGFYETMLRLSGVDALPEGEDLIRRFVNHARQSYGAGGTDTIDVGTHWVRRTLLPGEAADGVAIPDMHFLRRANRNAAMAKLMGIAEGPLIEAAQNRVWKPAVLLRIGFIPRAAGEEMLSFFMRGGIGQLGQELGARSLARANRYYDLQVMLASEPELALQLRAADRALLEQGPLPFRLNPVARKMARYEWAAPINRVIDDFARYYEATLQHGWRPNSARTLRTMLQSGIDRAAGSSIPLYETAADAGIASLRNVALTPAELNRRAIGKALDSVVFGSPMSWRRMAAGGVHDDLLEAAARWQENYAGTIMRQVGSHNLATLNPDNQDSKIVTRMVHQDGELRPIQYEVIRGERVLRRNGGDPLYYDALHDSVTRLVDDPFVGPVVMPHVARIKPEGLAGRDVAEVALAHHEMTNPLAIELVGEYVRGEPDIERLLAIARRLERSTRSDDAVQLGIALRTRLDPEALTVERLLDILDELANARIVNSGAVARTSFFDNIHYQIDRFNGRTETILDRLPADHRAWMAGYLRHSTPDHAAALVLMHDMPVPGNASTLPFTLDAAERARPYYESWTEMETAVRDAIRGALRDPEYADLLGRVQGLADTGGPVDLFGEATQRRGIGQVWHPAQPAYVRDPNDPAKILPVSNMTFEDFLNRIPDQAYAAEQYDNLAFIHLQMAQGHRLAVADRYLADQITAALAGPNRRADAIDIALDRLSENADDLLDAVAVGGARQPTVWVTKTAGEEFPAFRRTIPTTLDEQLDQYADDMLQMVRHAVTRGQTRTFLPRVRKLDDGSTIAAVYERNLDGELIPVPADERITNIGRVFYDRHGNRIDVGDTNYFRDEVVVPGNEVMNELVGPALEDLADVRTGRALLSLKSDLLRHAPAADAARRPETYESVRLYRSKPEHAVRVAADAAPWVEGLNYRVVQRSKWDDFVRFGFDRVIGPSIDALARRPMAFHFFAERYMQGMRARNWLRSPQLVEALDSAFFAAHTRYLAAGQGAIAAEEVATEGAAYARQVGRYARKLAAVDAGAAAKVDTWSTAHALSWLRGHSDTQLAEMYDRVLGRAAARVRAGDMADDQLRELEIIVGQLRAKPYAEITAIVPEQMSTNDVLAYARTQIPELHDIGGMTEGFFVGTVRRQINEGELGGIFARFTDDELRTLFHAQRNFAHISREVGDAAAVAAINDMVPFIDSHEFKTQFAEIGRPFMPFWYAEENFLKRWARTLWQEGPAVVRKMQLGYMGLRTAGTIRSDNNGRDWFVWPGSGLLQDALTKVTGQDLPIGTMFQSPTDSILPGFNSRVGTPQFGPLVSVPAALGAKLLPELEPLERGFLGEVGASRGVVEQLIPASLVRTWQAATADEGNTRLMSAMMTAISYLEVQGFGLPDDATAGERDEYLRKVRNWARVIMVAQALGGWFSPGPLTMKATDDGSDLFADPGFDPVTTLNSTYIELVQDLGLEEGTLAYLSLVPDTDLSELVRNPDGADLDARLMAATGSRSDTRSGAPLPATELAGAFFTEYEDYIAANPYATPWLLPVAEAADSDQSMYAYDQQLISGLRRMQTPAEFLDELKFKEGATRYFTDRRNYLDAVAAARTAGNTNEVRRLNDEWERNSQLYLAAHPIFAERLQASDSRQRRAAVIDEMRVVARDPGAPVTPVLPLIRQLLDYYDDYVTYKAQLSLDTSARGRLRTERFKAYFEQKMDEYVTQNPGARPFWLSVLRPESALD